MSGNSRKSLIEDADRLGIPWTNDTSDEQLSALLEARTKGAVMAVAEERPECFGLMWEAVVPSSMCAPCRAKDGCLKQFVATTLPETMKAIGDSTPAKLAAHLSVDERAVSAALATMEGQKRPTLAIVPQPVAAPAPVPAPVVQAPPPVISGPPPLAAAGEMDFEEDDEPQEQDVAPPPPQSVQQPVKPAESEGDVKKETKKAKAEKAPKAEKPPKAEKKKSGKKEAEPEVKAEVPVNPTKAGTPASAARVPAKARKVKTATPARAQVARRRQEPWGEPTFPARWERDVKKLGLEVGRSLETIYKKLPHKCQVKQGHYLYDGRRFATLYCVTKEIVGTADRPKQALPNGKVPDGTRGLCNYSASKFWKLGKRPKAPKASKVQRVSATKKKSSTKLKATATRKAPPKRKATSSHRKK